MKSFICPSSLYERKICSCHTTWQSLNTIFFICIISRIFTFPPMERTSRLLLGLEALPASLLLRFVAFIAVNKGFLNTNTAITRQLIRTAKTLEAEWWQVCGEAWVRGQREMSQVLGAFGLLDFTMIGPVLAWRAFWNLWTVYLFNFPIFFSGRGKPQISETADTESAYTGSSCTCISLYFVIAYSRSSMFSKYVILVAAYL